MSKGRVIPALFTELYPRSSSEILTELHSLLMQVSEDF